MSKESSVTDGGRNAIRGILCQAAVCLVNGLENDDWHSVQMEGLHEEETFTGVDIVWQKKPTGKEEVLTVEEVKSSVNPFSNAKIEEYAEKFLKRYPGATQHNLHLVGERQDRSSTTNHYKQVRIINRFPLKEENLLEGVRDALLRYSVRKKVLSVSPAELLFLADALVAKLLDFSVASVAWERKDFEWFIDSRLCPPESPWKSESEELQHFEKIFGFRAPPLLRQAVLLFYLAANDRTAAWQLKIAKSRLFCHQGRLCIRVNKWDRAANFISTGLLWTSLGIGIFFLIASLVAGSHDNQLNKGLLMGLVVYFIFLIPAIAIAYSNQEQSVAVRLHRILNRKV